MDKSKTLSELCSTLQVSRRAIQGYENADLVSATGKNKYGHLLYDQSAQRRIQRIRTTVESEAKNEARRFLEYDIRF